MAAGQLEKISGFSSTETADFPYRQISRAAIISVLLFALATIGLIQTFAPLLVLAVVGIVQALIALRVTARYPDEYGGRLLAIFGLVLNSVLITGGLAWHGYVYATEVPDGYERVGFYELQMPEPAEDRPTPRAIEIDGRSIFLKGYIHPASGAGLLRRFILVPDLGTCCFGGQPRSTDMIEVTLSDGQTVTAGFSKLKLAGKFMLNPLSQKSSGIDNPIYYQMRAERVR